MAAPESISQVEWKGTVLTSVNTVLRYTPLVAKTMAVGVGAFALRNVQPLNYLYAFPLATVLTCGLYLEGIETNNSKTVYFAMKTSRILSSIAFGGLALWRFTHLQRDRHDILRVLTGVFCLTTAASAFYDKMTPDMVREFLARCEKFNPSKLDRLKSFFTNYLRLPLATNVNLQSAFMLQSDLEGMVKPSFDRIGALLKNVDLSTLAEMETEEDPSDVGQSIAQDIENILLFIKHFPDDLKLKFLDRVLDIFVGQTLPWTIISAFEKNLSLFSEELFTKTQSVLDMVAFMHLHDRVVQLEEETTVDLAELEMLNQTFKEIAQNAERCELFADQALKDQDVLQPIAQNARKEILRITALQNKHRPVDQRPKDKVDLSTGLFERLFEATGTIAEDLQDRQKQIKKLEEMLCAFFQVPKEELYNKMDESELSTLQKVVEKGICTKEEVEDNVLFVKRMKAHFEKKVKKTLAVAPSKKEEPENLVSENPFESSALLLYAPVIPGMLIAACAEKLFGRFAAYRKGVSLVSYPFLKYSSIILTELPIVPNLPLVFRIHAKVIYLFQLTVGIYPFWYAASMGYRIPYLKTVSIAFPMLLGFSWMRQ